MPTAMGFQGLGGLVSSTPQRTATPATNVAQRSTGSVGPSGGVMGSASTSAMAAASRSVGGSLGGLGGQNTAAGNVGAQRSGPTGNQMGSQLNSGPANQPASGNHPASDSGGARDDRAPPGTALGTGGGGVGRISDQRSLGRIGGGAGLSDPGVMGVPGGVLGRQAPAPARQPGDRPNRIADALAQGQPIAAGRPIAGAQPVGGGISGHPGMLGANLETPNLMDLSAPPEMPGILANVRTPLEGAVPSARKAITDRLPEAPFEDPSMVPGMYTEAQTPQMLPGLVPIPRERPWRTTSKQFSDRVDATAPVETAVNPSYTGPTTAPPMGGAIPGDFASAWGTEFAAPRQASAAPPAPDPYADLMAVPGQRIPPGPPITGFEPRNKPTVPGAPPVSEAQRYVGYEGQRGLATMSPEAKFFGERLPQQAPPGKQIADRLPQEQMPGPLDPEVRVPDIERELVARFGRPPAAPEQAMPVPEGPTPAELRHQLALRARNTGPVSGNLPQVPQAELPQTSGPFFEPLDLASQLALRQPPVAQQPAPPSPPIDVPEVPITQMPPTPPEEVTRPPSPSGLKPGESYVTVDGRRMIKDAQGRLHAIDPVTGRPYMERAWKHASGVRFNPGPMKPGIGRWGVKQLGNLVLGGLMPTGAMSLFNAGKDYLSEESMAGRLGNRPGEAYALGMQHPMSTLAGGNQDAIRRQRLAQAVEGQQPSPTGAPEERDFSQLDFEDFPVDVPPGEELLPIDFDPQLWSWLRGRYRPRQFA